MKKIKTYIFIFQPSNVLYRLSKKLKQKYNVYHVNNLKSTIQFKTCPIISFLRQLLSESDLCSDLKSTISCQDQRLIICFLMFFFHIVNWFEFKSQYIYPLIVLKTLYKSLKHCQMTLKMKYTYFGVFMFNIKTILSCFNKIFNVLLFLNVF